MRPWARSRGADGRRGDSSRGYVDLYGSVLRKDRICLCGMLAAEHPTLPAPMQRAPTFFDANAGTAHAASATPMSPGPSDERRRIRGPHLVKEPSISRVSASAYAEPFTSKSVTGRGRPKFLDNP